MLEKFKRAFEEARPYLQKPEVVEEVLEELSSEEEIIKKVEECEKGDKILGTDLKIVLNYLRRV